MFYKMSMLATLIVSASAVPASYTDHKMSPLKQGAATPTTVNNPTKPAPAPTSDEPQLGYPSNAAYVQKDILPNDMQKQIENYCKQHCNGEGLEWHILGDPELEGQEWLPAPTYVQAHPERITWSGLDNPKVSTTTKQAGCVNHSNATMICKNKIEYTAGSSMTYATETTSTVGVEFSVSLGIPAVYDMSVTSSFEVSMTSREEKEEGSLTLHSKEVEVTVPPGHQVCSYITQKTSEFESTWTIPMSITDEGYKGIRCQYSSPCNGHYFHFLSIDGLNLEYMVSGRANDKTSMSSGNAVTRDGPCDDKGAVQSQITVLGE